MPDETRSVQFLIPCRELGLWDKNMHYIVEPGEFEIMTGSSSEDIRLKDTIKIRQINRYLFDHLKTSVIFAGPHHSP